MINDNFVIAIYDKEGIAIEKWIRKVNNYCRKLVCYQSQKNLVVVKSCEIIPNLSEEYLKLINKTKSLQKGDGIIFIGDLNNILDFIKNNKNLTKHKKSVFLIEKNGDYLAISKDGIYNIISKRSECNAYGD